MVDAVELGRAAYARGAWSDAIARLTEIATPAGEDLERLAIASFLVGDEAGSARWWERAHAACLDEGDHATAARCATWLGLALILGGDPAQGGGWVARAERAAAATPHECAAQGLLLIPPFLAALDSGDHATAHRLAAEMVAMGERLGDRDVWAIGTLSLGETSVARGDIGRATRFFDDVMVSVTTQELSPLASGIVYCAVIDACMHCFDLRRAAEWTEALHRWCESQPDLVPYRGQCQVHRSQVLLAHGSWTEAAAEAEMARQRLADPAHPALGQALYQQGELHRLRGEFEEADAAYRAASAHGREPAPGLALLRLTEGKLDAAAAAIRRIIGETTGQLARPAMLAAGVEILVAVGDADGASAAAAELADLATSTDAPLLDAIADFAAALVLLAGDDAQGALSRLRAACNAWRSLKMPYDEALARVQIGMACRALGDADGAELELEAARSVFDRLGAAPDRDRVERLLGTAGADVGGTRPLTDRECQVLRLVATGRTNREIAATLIISEHTVARHLQNIFMKLGLSSRAAATAYAYEHDMV